MKKSKIISFVLAVGMVAGVASSCKSGGGSDTAVLTRDNYNAELLSEAENVSAGYNGNLFYVNTLEFQVADPSVIYISEGDEAGYFYAYGTSDEIGCHGFQAWRSKDLSHWECTGIAYAPDYSVTWAVNNYWAPEVIYDAKTKLYICSITRIIRTTTTGCACRLPIRLRPRVRSFRPTAERTPTAICFPHPNLFST